MTRILGLMCFATLMVGCSTYYAPAEVQTLAGRGIARSKGYLEEGKKVEASIFARAVAKIDPDYEGLSELSGELELDEGEGPTALGLNRARYRVPVKRSIAGKIVMYLPDRILDLLDIVTFDVNVGPGLYIDVHATRALQASAGGRMCSGLGWHDMRSLGFQGRSDAGFSILPIGAQGSFIGRAGTSGFYYASDSVSGIHGPKDSYYQDIADYYAIGAGATLGLVGFEFDFHPLQLVDFFAGIVCIDFLNDDFANTRGLSFTYADRELLKDLAEIVASEKSLEDYAAGKPPKAAATVEEDDDPGFIQ